MVKEEFHIVANCPTCGTPCELWLTEVPTADLAAETAHDAESTEDVDLECTDCGEGFSMTIRAGLAGWEVFLTDDPAQKGKFEHLDYGYDEWLEQMEPEPHPRTIFDLAVHEWSDLVHKLADRNDGGAGINRMLFMQLFSIVEAFLADAIQRLAFDYDDVATAIVLWNPKLAKENVTLKTVAEKPDIVREIVIESLRRMQYHNFELVDGLTKAALNHRILPQGDDNREARDAIMGSVIWRHHCVHRNGRDLDGNMLDSITIQFLNKLSGLMVSMAADLDFAIDGFVTEKQRALIGDLDDFAEKGEEDGMDKDIPF